MNLGQRLREVRMAKQLSQGEIERRTGLLRCYISRVENNHTMPALETLEKMARAYEIHLYELLYDGEEPPSADPQNGGGEGKEKAWGTSGKEARYLSRLRRLVSSMDDRQRQLLMEFLLRMVASPKGARRKRTSL